MNPAAVTENSISRSEIRHHALLLNHTATYNPPGALAPAWFAAAINPLNVQVAGITELLAALSARIDNQRVHRQNRFAWHAGAEVADDDAAVLTQIFKTIAGAGPGLPGQPPIPPPALVPLVGSVPGPLFPANIGTLRAITVLQLHQLSAFYNDDFGILVGDTLDVQRKKFKAFISGV